MMMTLIAAALAAAQPAPAPADHMGQMPMMHAGEMPMMQMGQSSDHKAMPCCKDCCKDMAGKDAEHKGHRAR
jgi:hypothetical protein